MPKGLVFEVLLVISAAAGAQSSEVGRWDVHVAQASARFGIPAEWIRRVMRVESGGRTTFNGRPITSHAGAMGLMQLMPKTWAEMRAKHGLGPDPHDPHDNILAGAAYLRAMYDRFGYPGMLAAYNAGPRRYAEHLVIGRPLPAETVAYVAALGETAPRTSAAHRKRSFINGIFVALGNSGIHDTGVAPSRVAPSSLFVRPTVASAASE